MVSLVIALFFLLGLQCSESAWDFPTESDVHVDLGFSIDRHESIDEVSWRHMLEFMSNFTSYLRIEETRSRVGLASFDSISTLDIELNDHNNTRAVQQDILNQRHGGYGRDIALGIFRLRADLFTRLKGDSANRNVGVLITNGVSDIKSAVREADLFWDTGATLLSIGVGDKIDKSLLDDISRDPENVLLVNSFSELHILSESLRHSIAKATVPRLYCPLDICVAIDRHETVTSNNWALTLEYVSELAWLSAMDDYDARFGLVSFDASSRLDIALGEYTDFSTLSDAIIAQPHGGTGRALDQALRSLRMECFNETKGERPALPNVAVLVTNGDSDAASALAEADLLKATGATVITIGVGDDVNSPLLVNISSNGPDNAFTVSSYQDLANNPDLTLPNMCPGPPPTPPPTTTASPSTTTTPPKPSPTPKPCHPQPAQEAKRPIAGFKIDLGYSIDRHQSIDLTEWQYMLAFIADLSASMKMESGSRIGLASFDSVSTLDIKLNYHDDLEDLQEDVLAQPHSGTGRDISLGIFRLRADLHQPLNGDQVNVKNVGILFTNGVSDFVWASREAHLYREANATLITVGIGPDVDYDMLVDISGSKQCPSCEQYVVCIDSFSNLANIRNELLNIVYETIGCETDDNTLVIVLCCTLIPLAVFGLVIAAVCFTKHHKNGLRDRSVSPDISKQNDNGYMDTTSTADQGTENPYETIDKCPPPYPGYGGSPTPISGSQVKLVTHQ